MSATRPEVVAKTSNLITALTGISPTTSPFNHKTCLDFALKTFRHGKYGSTSHFDVQESLQGLEEKFRVRDTEELANELKSRLDELDKVDATSFLYKPEVLKLLLELSERPVESAPTILNSLDDIVQAKEAEQQERELKLAEEEKAELGDRDDDEGIWAIPDFAASSSDESDWAEDEFTKQAEKRERKKAARKRAEAEEKLDQNSSLNLDDYIRVAHAAATQGIELAQYWSRQTILPVNIAQNFLSYGYTEQEVEELWAISELHVVREVIFALYGLPSNLFKFQDDGSINVIARYVIDNTSPGALNDILDHFAGKAVILQKLRTFSKWLEKRCNRAKTDPTNHDAIAPAQSFIEAIQTAISKWELDSLVPTEEKYVRDAVGCKEDVMVSLLQLQRELDPSLERFTPLYEIVIALERGLGEDGLSEPAARVSFHLELLFKKTCEAESNGQQEIFKFLRGIFLPCLRTYLRPISKWMEIGELREADGQGAFFVHPANEDDEDEDSAETSQLAKLWHGQYVLDRDERDTIVAPSFIREYGKKIFITGKSILFLRKLGEVEVAGGSGLAEALEGLSTLSGSEGGRSLTSFNDALLIAISDWVDRAHEDVSARLRDILYYECGLWDSLDGLVDVYFMRDGFAITSFCNTLFERIDKGHKKWDDRFLLTELMQSVYSENYAIDLSRLTIRSKRQEMDRTAAAVLMQQRRSVKVLGLLVADYRLSWPIMNIITSESIDVCRKIWGFLLMIRRARTSLERMKLGVAIKEGGVEKLVLSIRWRLVTFISLLHAFLVDLVGFGCIYNPDSQAC
ncbi:hypothetical protein ABW19_dt0204491 [Dactylella cylindrospora]|nr:hypothetical protein ABW19_dt0204491 [Dactylella cylindrospora]